ncbi:Uncharacterized conserved protein [Ceraceosorus bombacis]|uniref:Uncharacterized conserved protein n=1 Tax=Ceraceosorus bombacis TaxID=401625 RepID=A0A0P1BI08_9BASI|nr:Uncharacterized conserved protein [Ceraceosorus bombacis]
MPVSTETAAGTGPGVARATPKSVRIQEPELEKEQRSTAGVSRPYKRRKRDALQSQHISPHPAGIRPSANAIFDLDHAKFRKSSLGVYVSADEAEVTAPLSIAEWAIDFLERTRTLHGPQGDGSLQEGRCEAGDAVYVPAGWWHLVVNITESVAFTQNLLNVASGIYIMTWNSAFPSSPLSRSALRGDTGLTNGHVPLTASTPPECYLEDASEASTSYGRSYRRVVSQPEGQQLQAVKGSQLGGQELDMARRRALKSSSTSAMLGLPTSSSPPPWSRTTPGSPGSPVSPRAGLGSPRRRVSAPGGPSPTATLSSSLVGSYEESLLSGRMSTNPSRPLPFDAELGVLGLGKLDSAPRCPPHLQLRFDAHFYALDGTSAREGTVATGTPYVGTVDLERHYLDRLYGAPRAESAEDGPPSSRATQSSGLTDRSSHPYREGTAQLKRSHVEEDIFGGTSAKPALFPGYRVPPKGQIQLVIKNPNLTAVKLFLVPYDLTEMPPGTKTFVRQKSHVATAGATDANSKTTTASPKLPPRSPADLRNAHLTHNIHSGHPGIPLALWATCLQGVIQPQLDLCRLLRGRYTCTRRFGSSLLQVNRTVRKSSPP